MRKLKKILRNLFRSKAREKRLYADRIGKVQVKSEGAYALVSYEKDGAFDYETYRQIQTEGNRRKLDGVFVQERVIRELAGYAQAHGTVANVICHGTRNGAEQRFFKSAIPGVSVLGTEISDTATQFPDTIEWDFHAMNEAWRARFDILYSNSWDHSYDPKILFAVWGACVAPGGLMALEHSARHEPKAVNPLDPFGVTFDGLVALVLEHAGMTHETTLMIEGDRPVRLALFRKPA